MKTWIIDRIEGEFAIVEFEGEFFEINLQFLARASAYSSLRASAATTSPSGVPSSTVKGSRTSTWICPAIGAKFPRGQMAAHP